MNRPIYVIFRIALFIGTAALITVCIWGMMHMPHMLRTPFIITDSIVHPIPAILLSIHIAPFIALCFIVITLIRKNEPFFIVLLPIMMIILVLISILIG